MQPDTRAEDAHLSPRTTLGPLALRHAPLDLQDEVVVRKTVDLLERSLGVGAVLERDEAKSLAETRFGVLADVDAAEGKRLSHAMTSQRSAHAPQSATPSRQEKVARRTG